MKDFLFSYQNNNVYSIFLFARSAFNKGGQSVCQDTRHSTAPSVFFPPPPSPTVILTSYNYWKGRGMPKHCHVTTSEVG